MAQTNTHRWRGRPVMAAALRFVVHAVPLAAAVGTSAVIVRAVPEASSNAQRALWWLVSFAVSTVVLWATSKLTHRALPLAVLLRLSLAFPNEAPSRWKMARRAANVRDLQARVERARAAGVDDEPTRAAERILELVAAVEAHDRATRGHSERVRIYTDLLAEELRLPVEARDRLRWASLLHDVGKLMVPAAVLNKPSKPTASEWELIREHPLEGARLIEPLRSWLGEWATAVDEHHERFDGTGYPYGNSAHAISLGGRMLAVADSFETMTAMRAYKRPMTPAKARKELVACAGTHFDPAIVRAFLQISVRRLGLLSGPLSWLAQMPILRGIEVAAANAARGATAGIAAGGTAFAFAVAPPPPAPEARRAPPVTVDAAGTRTVSELPRPDTDEQLQPQVGATQAPAPPRPSPWYPPSPEPTPPPTVAPSPAPSRSPEPWPEPSEHPTVEPSPQPTEEPPPPGGGGGGGGGGGSGGLLPNRQHKLQ